MKVLQTNGLKALMASIRDKFIKKEDTIEVETIDIDNIPTQNSNNLVKSGGVYTALATKLTEPSTALAVGKYFRIASIDADGHAVLECVDFPIASQNEVGGVILSPSYGGYQFFDLDNGRVTAPKYLPFDFRKKRWYENIGLSFYSLDAAIRAAMTDGIGAAWTDAERLAALLRMGCTVDENGFVKWTATTSK